jgi:hypothetical protein
MMPTASVLIPCRNAERWLEQAIRSALACDGVGQVVVVDDGSTDRSADIARSFGDRIEFIAQTAAGGNAARNRLLQAARGEWLQYLDADDYLEPHKITRQWQEAKAPLDADVLYSPVWIETWHNGRTVERVASTIDTGGDLFAQWIAWQLPQTGGALWRADALRRIGGWKTDQPCCQEHELYLRALQAGLRWQFCPSPGAVYRVWSEDTVCRRDPVEVIRQRTQLIDRALDWLVARHQQRDAHVRAAGQACFEMARTWAKYDLPAAAAYYRERRTRGLIQISGPAGSRPYRATVAALGFRRAESLAALARRAR